MELVYVWVKNHLNPSGIGLNLSPKWDIYMYGNKNLKIKYKGKELTNFFPNNIRNITAIIGSNGVGKTSILNQIFEIYRYNDNGLGLYKIPEFEEFAFHLSKNPAGDYTFALFDLNPKRKQTPPKKTTCKFLKNYREGGIDRISQIRFDEIKAPLAITYYSPVFEEYRGKRSWNEQYIFNLSDKYILENLPEESNLPLVESFFLYQFRRTCNFILRYREDDEFNNHILDSIPLPEFVKLYLIEVEFFTNDSPFNEIETGFFKYLFEQVNNFKKSGISLSQENERLLFVHSSILFNLLNTIGIYWGKHDHTPKYILDSKFYENHPLNEDPSIDIISKYFSDALNIIANKFEKKESTKSFLGKINELVDLFAKKVDQNEYENFAIHLSLSKAQEYITESARFRSLKIELIYDLLKIGTQKVTPSLFFFRWSSPLSYGQQKLLSIFARFFDLRLALEETRVKDSIDKGREEYKRIDKIKTLIIVIDEAELGFHPQWQKNYLKLLLEGISHLYKDKEHLKLQFILSSHSPFVVSDLPKENIIFLKKDEEGKTIVVPGVKKENTFGANIHTLFADAFFMEGGLIGEFAKGKINFLFKRLYELKQSNEVIRDSEKVEIKNLISIIGEPILARKLGLLYDEVFQEDLEGKIIEKQIKHLQNLQKRKGK
jgi:hypothetical protein